MKISVIIPTYKRPKKLLRLLQSLQKQTFRNFEAIVVDNDADENIKKLIIKFNKKTKIPIRYVSEPNLGLHNVRHRGAKEAHGDLLILTEDEVTFSPHWVEAYKKAFETHPKMVAAGAPLKPKWETKPSNWVRKLVGDSGTFSPFSLIDQGNKFFCSPKVTFFGGNMAIRKKTLFEVGGFNPEYFGDELWGDGETGLNNKLTRRNLLIGYVPNALIYHHVDEKRMSVTSLLKWMENAGRCDVYSIMQEKGLSKNWLSELKYIQQLIFINLKNWLGAFFIKSPEAPFWLNYRLQEVRTKSQFEYINLLMKNTKLRKLVMKKNWI